MPLPPAPRVATLKGPQAPGLLWPMAGRACSRLPPWWYRGIVEALGGQATFVGAPGAWLGPKGRSDTSRARTQNRMRLAEVVETLHGFTIFVGMMVR